MALAVQSGRIDIPPDSPFSEVIVTLFTRFCLGFQNFYDLLQELLDLIREILVVDPKERPFVSDILVRVKQLEAKNQGCV